MDVDNSEIIPQQDIVIIHKPPRKNFLLIILGIFFLFGVIILIAYFTLSNKVSQKNTTVAQTQVSLESISATNHDKIAFLRGGQIFVANSDGSSVEQVTEKPSVLTMKGFDSYFGALNWSPDKTKLSFVTNIYKCLKDESFYCTHGYPTYYDFKTKKTVTIFPKNDETLASDVTWSPDSKYIAYLTNAKKLIVSDTATGEVISTIPSVEGEMVLWSPFSNQLLMYGYTDAESTNITIVNSDGGNRRTITGTDLQLKEHEFSAVWGRSDSELLLSEFGTDMHMYFLNLTTKSLTPFPPQQYSPDGHDSPYVSRQKHYIFLRSIPAGANPTDSQRYALFSSDGQMITDNITMNVPHPFNFLPLNSWSPDEEMFVMEGKGAAWKVSLNGEATKIIDDARDPVWSNFTGEQRN